ncbi:MAG TPA: alpha/beta hydrolase [Candidatus Bathyarchaeia archaeon]|nr:alpha/beta hydrolase [Candidatus Bathyarchaeia archaeon]
MFKDRYRKVNGAKIRFFDEGKGSVVVLVHGFGGSVANWKRNIGPLSKKFRVIALDMPSFGKSAMPKINWDKINYDLMSDYLKKVLNVLKIKRAAFVGSSMGGGIVLNFALRYPKMAEKMVIVGSAGFGREVFLYRLLAFPFLGRLLVWLTSREVVARRLVRLVVEDPLTLDEESFYDYINWQRKPEIQKILAKFGPKGISLRGQRWILVDKLEKLSLPTLIIWGEKDHLVPLKHGQRAHRLIKGSKLVVFDDCGHIPMMEKPEKFNQELLSFLAGD